MTIDQIDAELANLKCDTQFCIENRIPTQLMYNLDPTDNPNEFSFSIDEHSICCSSFRLKIENKYKELTN